LLDWLAEQYGNLASVAGLLVAVCTLAVAWRTQVKVQEVRNETRKRILRSFLLSRIGEALHLVERVVQACEGKNWAEARLLSNQARKTLKRSSHQSFGTPEQCQRVRRFVQDLQVVEEAIEGKSKRKDGYGIDQRKLAILRLIVDELVELETDLWASTSEST
jgi:hypothetical protein